MNGDMTAFWGIKSKTVGQKLISTQSVEISNRIIG